MKVIVTGGAGYIGSHTVIELIDAGYTPVIMDDFRNSHKFVIECIEQITKVRPIVEELDLTNESAVMDAFSRHYDAVGVIHFAAMKSVGESVDKPVEYWNNNVGSLIMVSKAMAMFAIDLLVFSSSAAVYGDSESSSMDEMDDLRISSPYGKTKIVCEEMIEDAFKKGS